MTDCKNCDENKNQTIRTEYPGVPMWETVCVNMDLIQLIHPLMNKKYRRNYFVPPILKLDSAKLL